MNRKQHVFDFKFNRKELYKYPNLMFVSIYVNSVSKSLVAKVKGLKEI